MPSYHQPKPCALDVNGRHLTLPGRPVVVLGLEGFGDEYLSSGLMHRRMPHLDRMVREGGFRGLARASVPSVSLVNHAAILCGVPPSATGISGNSWFEAASGGDAPLDRPEHLRTDTVLAAAAQAERRVGLITAREHGREMLAKGMSGISFSAERAREATTKDNGISGVESLVGRRTPAVEGMDLSLFALEAATTLVEEKEVDFLYLTLSDWVPLRHAPWEQPVLEFLEEVDEGIGHLLRTGAWVGVVAAYGTTGKQADGAPAVVYLQKPLAQAFGGKVRISRPAADPYSSHHAGLSGCVMLHVDGKRLQGEVTDHLLGLDGVEEVLPRKVAAAKLELPEDRTGDLVVLAARGAVLGLGAEDHDLAALSGPFRSHGSRHETLVPFVTSTPMPAALADRAGGDLRSHDLFPFLCSAKVASPQPVA